MDSVCHREIQPNSVAEPLQEVARSNISLVKCGKEGVITWRENTPSH